MKSNHALASLVIGLAVDRSEAMEREEVEALAEAILAEGINRAQVAKGIVEQTNEFRKDQGFEVVSHNQTLTDAPTYVAQRTARTEDYGRQADGQASARVRAVAWIRLDYCMVSDNIAYRYRSSGFEGQGANSSGSQQRTN